jgi:hypothetical protein
MTVTEGSKAPPFDIDISIPASTTIRGRRTAGCTHYCLGANLARAEITVVFEELFRRLRDIRAVDTDTLQRGDSTLVLALSRLPAVFTPEMAVPSS